jgi:hypothetical protein
MSQNEAESYKEKELQKYIEEPCLDEKTCPLTYWKENQTVYPSLAEIATKVLGIPASSAAVERLFSIAGKVLRPERCCLSDSTFSKLMFVKCKNAFFKH